MVRLRRRHELCDGGRYRTERTALRGVERALVRLHGEVLERGGESDDREVAGELLLAADARSATTEATGPAECRRLAAGRRGDRDTAQDRAAPEEEPAPAGRTRERDEAVVDLHAFLAPRLECLVHAGHRVRVRVAHRVGEIADL